MQDTIRTAREFGIAHEVLDAEEIRRRYPQFNLSGDEVGYFEAAAGFLRPEACIEAQLNLARHLGAKALTSEIVLDISQDKHGAVEVKTDRATYSGARVIVTAGPWMQKLLGAEYARYFRIYRQVLCWFAWRRTRTYTARSVFPCSFGSWATGRATCSTASPRLTALTAD